MQSKKQQFPEYSAYSDEQLLTAYLTGPDRLRQAIKDLAEDELKARPRGPEKWSIHELVQHVFDSELQGAFRIRKVIAEPGAPLPGYDQDRWTQRLGHQQASADERNLCLDGFLAIRELTAKLFKSAPSTEWDQLKGAHPDFGEVSLRNLLQLYADHSERHIEHILESRKLLGRGIELPQLLPIRLY
ncbi:MAG: DinB family protein [Terriglobales bacterium]|jgi:hypothetical protein